MAGQSQGAQSRIAIDGVEMNYLKENLTTKMQLIDDGAEAMRGSRQHREERVGLGLFDISGSIWLNPTPLELDTLLPLILGGTESADSFPFAESLSSFAVDIHRVEKVHHLSTCYVDRAIFVGETGKYLQLQLQIMGTSESTDDTFSPGTSIDNDQPWWFSDAVLTLLSSTRLFNRFVLIIDNVLEREYNNSDTPTDFAARDSQIYLAHSTPYTSDESGLYTTPIGDASGDSSATLKFDRTVPATEALYFTFGNLKHWQIESPQVRGKQQIRLPNQWKAFEDSSNDALTVTNTPA